MDKIIGYCGLICTECPAYLATMNNDDELRQKTAEMWSRMFNAEIKAENINCEGCIGDGIKFHHCSQCEIRACGMEKGIKNCGHCEEYPCDKIVEFQKMVPESKDVLDSENQGA